MVEENPESEYNMNNDSELDDNPSQLPDIKDSARKVINTEYDDMSLGYEPNKPNTIRVLDNNKNNEHRRNDSQNPNHSKPNNSLIPNS